MASTNRRAFVRSGSSCGRRVTSDLGEPKMSTAYTASTTQNESLNAQLLHRLMPLLVAVYVINFLDRTNIALARQSMSVDLGLSDAAYGLGAGLFFLTYSICEIPSNLIMQRVGARFWISRIMVTWGAVSVAMAFVRGETSFYAMRLLLGVAEAGLFPGVMLYLTYWFGREERARATGYFLIGVCIASIVGGPLGGALLELDGRFGLRGWQWLFVIEGVPAILAAFVVYKVLPDRPTSAPWLSRDDAGALESRLAKEQDADSSRGDGHGAQSFRRCLTDRQMWLAILVYFCHQLTVYTVIFFLPGIIGRSGDFSPIVVGLLTAAPWVAAGVGAVTLPRFATSSRRSRRLLVGGLVVMAAGMIVMAATDRLVFGLAGVCLSASMFLVVLPVLWTFPTSRLSGSALAGGLGLMNSCGLVGAFVGPTVMGRIEQLTGRSTNGLVLLAGTLVFAAGCSTFLRHGNEHCASRARTARVAWAPNPHGE